MKRLLYFVVFLLLAGCASEEGYVVTGKVPAGWEGKAVELWVADVNEPYLIDSTVISNGTYQLKGKFDISRYCRVVVYLDPERQRRDLVYNCALFLDSTAVRIDCDNSGKKPVFTVTTTSATQVLYQKYLDDSDKLKQELKRDELFDRYVEAQYRENDEVQGMELAKQVSAGKQQMRSFQLEFVKEHSDSPVSLYIARKLCGDQSLLSREEIDGIWARFPAGLQHSEPGKDFEGMIRGKKLFLGQPFLDMELITPEGGTRKISDCMVPGHYTLLEFWASWCAPCRGEIPHMKRAYKKYHSRGFDIVSVSIDVNPDNWKKALAEEDMPWTQLCDWNRRKHPEKSAFNAYEVSGVPCSVMLDDRGNIVDFNARGGWLNLILKEKFD